MAEVIEDDLEEVQDWKLLGLNQDVIPKRGEKDFEPDGTQVQSSLLDDSRNAMYLALSVNRGHTIKQLLNAVWYPNRQRAYVPHLKGPYFKDIGEPVLGSKKRVNQAAWLSPIETMYLCERGTLRVYLHNEKYEQYIRESELVEDEQVKEFAYDEHLISVSLSHLYGLAFSSDPTLIEKYQVYAYLKRLGYLILPFKDSSEEQRREYENLTASSPSTTTTIFSFITNTFRYFQRQTVSSYLLPLKHYFDYLLIFRAIRLIPSYSTYDSLKYPPSEPKKLTPSFDVWKPTPQFSKKSPPSPDFQIVIMDTNESSFPSLPQIQHLFNSSRHKFSASPVPLQNTKKTSSNFPTKREMKAKKIKERQLKLDPLVQKRIEYGNLRDKKYKFGASGRCFVIALIDNGVFNFINLSEGDFALENFGTQELQNLSTTQNTNHGIVW